MSIYGYIEALAICQGKGFVVAGKASTDQEGFDMVVNTYWGSGNENSDLYKRCCFATYASSYKADNLDFWIPGAFKIDEESSKIERLYLSPLLDAVGITPKTLEKEVGVMAEEFEEIWGHF